MAFPLSGPGNRTSPEFQKLLGIAMEMFLLCSDDSESDVRMVADECLNKIIKVSKICKMGQMNKNINDKNVKISSLLLLVVVLIIHFDNFQALMDSNLPRLQLELYKEIKKVRHGVVK